MKEEIPLSIHCCLIMLCSLFMSFQESSRKAADSACKSLHKVTVRSCDGSTMSKSGKWVCGCVCMYMYMCVCAGEFLNHLNLVVKLIIYAF